MKEIFENLTEYTFSLIEALEKSHESHERPMLTKHLAAAAEIYARLYRFKDINQIETLIKSEIRNHGWAYISGDAGTEISKKWSEFTKKCGVQY